MGKVVYAELYEWYESRNAYVEIFGSPDIKNVEKSYFEHLAKGDKVILKKKVEYKPNLFKRLLYKLKINR